jgi:hypothetical protein
MFLTLLYEWLGWIKRRGADGLSEAERIQSLERKVCPDCGCPEMQVLDTSSTAWDSTSTETREATIRNRDGDATGSIEWEVEVPVRKRHTEDRLSCWFCNATYKLTITKTT